MDFSRRDSSHKRSVLMLGAGVKSRRRGFALGRGVTLRGFKSHPQPSPGSLGFPLSLHTRWESDFLWTRGPVSGQIRTSGRIPVGSAWGVLLLGFGQTGTGRLLCAESPLQGGVSSYRGSSFTGNPHNARAAMGDPLYGHCLCHRN